MLPSIRSKLARGQILLISKRTSVHFKHEPEKAPLEFGKNREELNMGQAIVSAMDLQLGRDESTIIFGEDVKFGGVHRSGFLDFGSPKKLVR